LNHHERCDGKGYPAGLSGDAIPQAAQIVSIVDVYDALTHYRIYRRALPEAEALAVMRDQQGAQFDSGLLTTFFTILDDVHQLAQQNPDAALVQPSAAGSFVRATANFALPLTTMVNL